MNDKDKNLDENNIEETTTTTDDTITEETILETAKSDIDEAEVIPEVEDVEDVNDSINHTKEIKKKNVYISQGRKTKFKHGTLAVITTVIVTIVIIVVNMIFTQLNDRYPIALDVTSDDMYAISEEAQEFIDEIDEPVEFIFMNDEIDFTSNAGNAVGRAHNIIKRYTQKNKNITTKYNDITKNPTFANKYPDLELRSYKILMITGEGEAQKVKAVDMNDMVSQDEQGNYTYNVEEVLTVGLMSLLSDNATKAVLLEGFDTIMPLAATGLESILKSNNYEVSKISLLTSEIPEDTDIVFLIAPARDLSEEEVKKIDTFLENDGQLGKTLYYNAIKDATIDTPNLNAMIADWGIAVGNSYIYETDENNLIASAQNPVIFLSGFSNAEYATSLKNKPNIAMYATNIELLFETSNTRRTSVLLEASEKAHLVDIAELTNADSEEKVVDLISGKGKAGPHIYAAMAKKSYGGSEIKYSQVIVDTSMSAVEGQVFASASYGNAEYFINILNGLYPDRISFWVAPKTEELGKLDITVGQASILRVALVFILPIFVLVIGVYVTFRRSRK